MRKKIYTFFNRFGKSTSIFLKADVSNRDEMFKVFQMGNEMFGYIDIVSIREKPLPLCHLHTHLYIQSSPSRSTLSFYYVNLIKQNIGSYRIIGGQ